MWTKCKLVLVISLSALWLCADAQEVATEVASDSLESTKKGLVPNVINYFRNSNKVSQKTFDCSVVAGPFYNATTSFAIGGGVSALYTWDKTDSLLTKSSLSAIAKVGIKGSVSIEVTGVNHMKHDRSRWNYWMKVAYTPMHYWGVGYDYGVVDDNKVDYKQVRIQFRPDYTFRVAKNFYMGFIAAVDYAHAYDFTNWERLDGQSSDVIATGVGVVVDFDSRDVSFNAYRGQFLRVEQLFYPKFMNKHYFNSTDVTFSTYHPLWKNAVLAMEYHSLFNYGGEVPWTMLALVASNNNRMRGYYEGRYRDKNIIEAQVEIRQRLPRRFGVVAFAGAANVFPAFDEINMRHTLPNYGVGARWEFKQRVNIRLDLGFTKNKPGVVFSINEAF